MPVYYTYINFSNVSCGRELAITVAVAFILCGFSLNFLLFCTFVPGCEFGFALRCCTLINVVIELCGDVFPYIYCAFFPSLVTDVVFLHRPIFQRENWPHISPNLWSFGHSPLLRIHPPFWTCFIWSWLKLPRMVVSIMIRIIMFRSWFAQRIIEHFSERNMFHSWSDLSCFGLVRT